MALLFIKSDAPPGSAGTPKKVVVPVLKKSPAAIYRECRAGVLARPTGVSDRVLWVKEHYPEDLDWLLQSLWHENHNWYFKRQAKRKVRKAKEKGTNEWPST